MNSRACSHVSQIHQTPPAALVGFTIPQYSPVNRACSHVYHIHQTPPAALVGFRTVYSQAMDALPLLLYQFHQSPTIGVPFYCMLMDIGGFGMVSRKTRGGRLIPPDILLKDNCHQ